MRGCERCEKVRGCERLLEGEARLARSRHLALGLSATPTEGTHPAVVALRGFAPELAVRLRAARLMVKNSGVGDFGGGWLEHPRPRLDTHWPGPSPWECRTAQSCPEPSGAP